MLKELNKYYKFKKRDIYLMVWQFCGGLVFFLWLSNFNLLTGSMIAEKSNFDWSGVITLVLIVPCLFIASKIYRRKYASSK